MSFDVGRVRHLAEQMHRSEDDAGDPIPDGYLLTATGDTGLDWTNPADLSGSSSGGFDVTPGLSNALPPWVKPSGSGVITSDPQGRITVNSGTTYRAFPGLTFLEGRLYCVYRDGTSHNSAGGVVRLTISNDLGRTWSSQVTIATPAGSDDNRDPIIGALASGRLLLYYHRTGTGGTIALDIRVRYSDDRGQTWSSEYTVPDSFSGQVAGSGSITELPDGDILISGYGESGGTWSAVTWRSTDGGLTFGDQVTIATDGSRDFYEPVVRYLSTGKLVALLRTNGTAHTYRAVSSDLGLTWAAETDVLTAGEGRPDFVEFFPNALLLFIRQSPGDDDAYWTVSWDGGATWTALQEVDAGETADQMYSAPVLLAPGYVAVVYCLESSGTDTDVYLRYYFDGYGTDPLGQIRAKWLQVDEQTAPATPPSGKGVYYAKSDSLPYFKSDAGTEYLLSGGGALDDLSDVTITAVATDDMLQYNGSVWVNSGKRWEPVTDGEDVFVWDGDDLVMEWLVY